MILVDCHLHNLVFPERWYYYLSAIFIWEKDQVAGSVHWLISFRSEHLLSPCLRYLPLPGVVCQGWEGWMNRPFGILVDIWNGLNLAHSNRTHSSFSSQFPASNSLRYATSRRKERQNFFLHPCYRNQLNIGEEVLRPKCGRLSFGLRPQCLWRFFLSCQFFESKKDGAFLKSY